MEENKNNEVYDNNSQIEDLDNVEPLDIDKESENYIRLKNGEVNLTGNQNENLIIISDSIINGGIFSKKDEIQNIVQNRVQSEKEYNLEDVNEFVKFVETVKVGEFFAIAVILCVFDYVELDDMPNLKSKLLEELPKIYDVEGKEIPIQKDAYIALNSILKTIGAKIVIMKTGQYCASLEEKRPAALENLWQQFPDIHSNIASWLMKLSDSFKYRTSFDSQQITAAFVNIIKLDFRIGVKHFFSRLYSNSNRYFLLGFIALRLYMDYDYKDKILPYIIDWTNSGSSWRWKSALYVYANIIDKNSDEELEKNVSNLIMKKISSLNYNVLFDETLPYIGTLVIVSEKLRTLIILTLNKFASNMKNNYNVRRMISYIYLEIIRNALCCLLRNTTFIDLPLVICDDKYQLEKMLLILNMVMIHKNTRENFFVIIDKYIKEILEFNTNKRSMNRLKAFMASIAEMNPYFYKDILVFLKKDDCDIKKELYDYLTYNDKIIYNTEG